MRFAWPLALLSLVALPLLAAFYLWQLRRRRRKAVAYSSVALLRAALPARVTWRRHVPVVLMLVALACLGLAAARPQARTQVPVAESALIVALDVSGSMCATDVEPNRLTAAQDAVRRFVEDQDPGVRIGLVVFSGFAQVAVAPTRDHDELLGVLDGLTTGRGTTIGAAILKSVDAIAEINPDVAPADSGGAAPTDGATPPAAPASGDFAPEIVVLLTDGANTAGVEPSVAAQVAAARGVRVYAIGFGTQNATSLACSASQLGGRGFGGFGGGGFGGGRGGGRGGRGALVADEDTLREVAATTGGQYFAASDANQLQTVLRDLPRQVSIQTRDIELTVAMTALAALLLLLSLWAAARWTAFPA
jgi:Ca-activated chloride channel family protein